jgi:hypothetical protein
MSAKTLPYSRLSGEFLSFAIELNTRYEVLCFLAILLEITANLYVHRLEIRHSKRGQANRQQGIPQAARQSARRKKTDRAPSRLWGAVDDVGERHGARPFNICSKMLLNIQLCQCQCL